MSTSVNRTNLTPSEITSGTTDIGLTQIELWIQQIGFYCIFGGIVSTVGNVAIAIGLIRSKKLRSRFFTILLYLVIFRGLFSSQLFIVFIHRTLRTFTVIPTNIERIYCYLFHLHAYYALTLEMVLLLGLVIDRAVAIVAYGYYRTLTRQQAIKGCSVATVITIILKIVPSLLGVDFKSPVACLNGYSPTHPYFNTYHQNIDVALCLIILIIYIALILYMHYRLMPVLKASQQGDPSAAVAFKRQMKLLPILRRLVGIHVGFALTAKFFLSLSGFLPEQIGLRFVAYGAVLVAVDLFANVVMLLACKKDLRLAAFPCLAWKDKVVATATAAVVQLGPAGTRDREMRVGATAH